MSNSARPLSAPCAFRATTPMSGRSTPLPTMVHSFSVPEMHTIGATLDRVVVPSARRAVATRQDKVSSEIIFGVNPSSDDGRDRQASTKDQIIKFADLVDESAQDNDVLHVAVRTAVSATGAASTAFVRKRGSPGVRFSRLRAQLALRALSWSAFTFVFAHGIARCATLIPWL
jgi:hypothetical protein